MGSSGRTRQSEKRERADLAPPLGTQRLDLWIWFARFLRARTTCADLVRKGYVRVNGRRVTSPGHGVRVGDVLTLALPGQTRLVRISGIAERREGPDATAPLYEDLAAEPSQDCFRGDAQDRSNAPDA